MPIPLYDFLGVLRIASYLKVRGHIETVGLTSQELKYRSQSRTLLNV
jgi:hypothetical protein